MAASLSATAQSTVTRIGWADLAPLHGQLQARRITADTFASYVELLRIDNARRVREGDLDHLIFYVLQSTRFSPLQPLEPALSARALVDGLNIDEREWFLRGGRPEASRIPFPVRNRVTAFVRALDAPVKDPRMLYFRDLVASAYPRRDERQADLLREYLRVMRFVYEKEFVAQRAARPAEAVADLYRTRGLSTDTAVEAGFLVYQGLGIVKSLHPGRPMRRVLIVGPGLDLAPRTAFAEDRAPESYQPWAVIDALVALGLSNLNELQVVAADINPRVVQHLERAREAPPVLTLISEIRETDAVKLTADYRDYFSGLGRRIGDTDNANAAAPEPQPRKTVKVRAAAARVLHPVRLDIVTERLNDAAFDLVIATNILPYFDDVGLMLALSNIASMLAAGGVLLHNESRPLMQEVTTAVGLPPAQSRHAVIATVAGAPPLADSVWLHWKQSNQQ